ncbi:MAG: Phageintegrase domain-containing protein [Nitrospira sp.]|nr:MAG: Phageintegrase domain-containing protein [Nitrospira sp.]
MARAGRKDRGLLSKKDSAGTLAWYVRLYHGGKERRFGSFPTKTAAREFYEKAKREQKEGQFFPERYQQGGYAKLDDVLDRYLAAFTGRSKRDEARFRKKWAALFPGARLNAITPAALEVARTQLSEGRTPQTVNRYLGFLRRVLNQAIRDGQLASNPVSRIKMFREPAGKTRFLSPEEERALCGAIGVDYAAMVRLAILTGMRQMEQFSLRWQHVDLDRGLITLPATKAGGVQYVRLNQESKSILQRLNERATKAQAVAEAQAIANPTRGRENRSPWVFPSENPSTHVDPRNFYRRVYLPTVKALGLDGVSWHTLRHTFASRLAKSGATERTIAALLRHSGTSLVRRYAHLSASHLQNEVEKVAAFGMMTSQDGKGDPCQPSQAEAEPHESVPQGELQPSVSVLTVTGTGTRT